MESSTYFNASQQPALSPDGTHVALLVGNSLQVRRITTLELVRSVDISPSPGARFLSICWSAVSSSRFLLADETCIRVYDLTDIQWSATIDNGSGSMGKIAHVEFGIDDTQVMVFSQFGAKLTVWDLTTGKGIQVNDPKFTKAGHGRSSGPTPMLALLTRSAAQDTVSLYTSGMAMVKSFIPKTVDAQGLKWSPDGRWLALWETPAMGYKILIYTADGNLFRTFIGDYYTDDLKGLGIKGIEWSPNGHFLAVAGFEKSISLLSTKTFGVAARFSHPKTANPINLNIFQEQVSPSRTYNICSSPMTPPAASVTPDSVIPKIGCSILAFSNDGAMLATRDDSMPTAVWIWNLGTLSCSAVLLQHDIVRKLLWHPTDPNILLVQCRQQTEGVLYSWNALEDVPRVLNILNTPFAGRADAQWVPKQAHRKPIIMLGDSQGFVFAYPDGRDAGSPDAGSPEFGGEQVQDEVEHESDDSLYEILSGRKDGDAALGVTHEDLYTADGFLQVDDTFRHKTRVGAAH